MADFTSTLTYSVTIDDRVLADTITETVSSATNAIEYKAICGTTLSVNALVSMGADHLTAHEIDAKFVQITNIDQTQNLTVEVESGTDIAYFELPPNGFIRFSFEGGGTYSMETNLENTQAGFTDISNIYGSFPTNEGEVLVLAIEA